MKRTTITFLAEKAGVSAKTVSKALNDQPGVNEETRKLIKALARKYNYISNFYGRGLRGISSKTIGIVISDNTNPNNAFEIKAIETTASEHGYLAIMCNANENILQEERYVKLLIERQIDGLILIPSYLPDGMERKGLALVEKFGIPCVLLSRNIPGKKYNYVGTNDWKGGRLATEFLIKHGHTKIIHLSLQHATITSAERTASFEQVMQEHDLATEGNITYCHEMSMESAYNAMDGLLQKRKDFTAVFAFNDIIALGAMRAIFDHGLRIPEDIAIVGYDNIPYSSGFLVPLTTVQQDSYGLGLKSMELLIDLMENPSAQTQQVRLDPTLIIRKSV